MSLGQMMKDERKRLSLSKAEVARRIGIPYTTYNGYETGARDPKPDMIVKIANVLEVDANRLLPRTCKRSSCIMNDCKSAVEIHIADVEPIKSVLAIVMEMINDDRVPMEYKARIAKELMGTMKSGGDST